MVHVVLHLPEEAILGGPVYTRWMYGFERHMKSLKAYVRNKAKPEGSIAEGYVAEEALKFCSMYIDGMQTKSNRHDRNVDDGIPKRHFSVFSSQCRPMSKKKYIDFSKESKNALQWFVLDNSDELAGYKSEFKSKKPQKDAKTYFPAWFNKKVNSLGEDVSQDFTNELHALAYGPLNAYSYTACIVNGVRFVVHSRDIRRTTQNSGVEPPKRPHKIPTVCESSKPRKRTHGKNLNLYEEYEKNNSRPLPIEFETTGKQFKFVGDNYQMLVRLISTEVRSKVPVHYPSWDDVPKKFKRAIYPTLHHYFDLDRYRGTPDWNGVQLGIEADCANSYRRRKNKLKAHFNEVGGYSDVDTAKLHPPLKEGMSYASPKTWVKVIDRLFTNKKYKARSQQNAANKGKQPYTSNHGSESYAQKRYKEVKTSGKAQYIEGWRKSHFKEGPGWINDRARADWDKIQNEYNKMVEEADSDSSVDEVECLKRALGERRGHSRGVGRKVKKIPAYYVPPTTQSTNSEISKAMAEQITQQLNQQLNQQLQEYLRSQNPNSQQMPQPFQLDPSKLQFQAPQTQAPQTQANEEVDTSDGSYEGDD